MRGIHTSQLALRPPCVQMSMAWFQACAYTGVIESCLRHSCALTRWRHRAASARRWRTGANARAHRRRNGRPAAQRAQRLHAAALAVRAFGQRAQPGQRRARHRPFIQ